MKSEEEIKAMLLEAEEEAKYWRDRFHSRTMDTKQNAECLRNYTALRGVKKTLRWVLENKAISPLR
tara:strand:+ start:27417 stop:27614 length:198 start_codon:yes stop_codon:yes gene_type:complete